MDPIRFEQAVADFFQQQGYVVKLTPRSYDYGVDVIASKENERVAVQAKMYEQRQVNYQDVMYLFAGRTIYDCDIAVLITSGKISVDARRVAEKLGVKLTDSWLPSAMSSTEQLSSKSEAPNNIGRGSREESFGKAWKQYVIPLEGTKVCTSTGKENLIRKVTWDYLERESSNSKASKIELKIFRLCYSHILENGYMTRNEINHLYSKRGSAIIFAVLARIPYFEVRHGPATLVLDNKSLEKHREA